jgi:hypothetical protein
MTWAPPANLATDMEQEPRRHMPTDGHTRKQPTAPTLTTSNAREICRTCADRASRKRPPNACHRHHLDSLQRSSDFKATSNHGRAPRTRREVPTTEDHAATQAPLDAIIVAKQKPTPRLSKPSGEDAALDGEDAVIHQSPSRSQLRDDAPKEEKDADTPPSPDPADLRFPSGAKAVWRRRSTPPRRRFQERSRHPRAPPSPAPKKTGARISPGDDHLQPPTAAHQPPPAEADFNLPRDPTIHHDQTRTAPWP